MPFDAAAPAQSATVLADAPSEPRTAPEPRGAACAPTVLRVVPCIDAASGSVTLFAAGRQETRRFADPALLTRALSRVVRPALWFPAERKLLLAVAARGYREGKELLFILD